MLQTPKHRLTSSSERIQTCEGTIFDHITFRMTKLPITADFCGVTTGAHIVEQFIPECDRTTPSDKYNNNQRFHVA